MCLALLAIVFVLFWLFVTEAHSPANPELVIPQPQPLQCWDYKHVSTCPTFFGYYSWVKYAISPWSWNSLREHRWKKVSTCHWLTKHKQEPRHTFTQYLNKNQCEPQLLALPRSIFNPTISLLKSQIHRAYIFWLCIFHAAASSLWKILKICPS